METNTWGHEWEGPSECLKGLGTGNRLFWVAEGHKEDQCVWQYLTVMWQGCLRGNNYLSVGDCGTPVRYFVEKDSWISGPAAVSYLLESFYLQHSGIIPFIELQNPRTQKWLVLFTCVFFKPFAISSLTGGERQRVLKLYVISSQEVYCWLR